MRRICAVIFILFIAVLSMPQQAAAQSYREEGIASWYGTEFDGRPTASGEIFNSALFTAAHPTLPFGTFLKVTNRNNNRQITVKVNDRGPFAASRIIDLSKAAAEHLDMILAGVAPVVIETLPSGNMPSMDNRPTVTAPVVEAPVQQPPPAAVEPMYTQPAYTQPAYTQPTAPIYSQPAPAYTQPAPTYSQPAPVYTQPAPAYSQPAPVYTQPAPAYSQPAPVYAQPAPVYTQPAPVAPQPVPQVPAAAQEPSSVAGATAGTAAEAKPSTTAPAAAEGSGAAYKGPPITINVYQPPQSSAAAQPEQQPVPPAPRTPSPQDTSFPPAASSVPPLMPPPQQPAVTETPPDSRPPAEWKSDDSTITVTVPQLPAPAPSVKFIPAITPSPDKKYRLQIGSYKLPQNAVAAFDKLKAVGLNPAYEQNGELYRVVVSGLPGTEVESAGHKLDKAGFREVIIREEK